MTTTYDVRVWGIDKYQGTRVTSYIVRWRVAGKPWKARYRNRAQADSFRSELLAAARKGEAFDVDTGRPVSMGRAVREMTWLAFACAFADMKWPRVAATTRRGHAEALTAVTTALLPTGRGAPEGRLLRSALCRWAFNTARRDDPACPIEVRRALRWAHRHSPAVAALRDPAVLRRVLDSFTVRLDGTPAAPSVTSRKRRILNTAVEYAIELGLLDRNPIPALKWTPPRTVQAIDRRRVINPIQARTLLAAVRQQRRSGPRLVAFFGCLYFAGLRPEEAVGLAMSDLVLPVEGWGQLLVARPGRTRAGSGPTAGAAATTASSSSEHAGRSGPCPARRS